MSNTSLDGSIPMSSSDMEEVRGAWIRLEQRNMKDDWNAVLKSREDGPSMDTKAREPYLAAPPILVKYTPVNLAITEPEIAGTDICGQTVPEESFIFFNGEKINYSVAYEPYYLEQAKLPDTTAPVAQRMYRDNK